MTATFSKPCTAKQGKCYCEKCSPGRTLRAQQFKELQDLPISRQPAEMLLNIMERIDLLDFPNFIIATLHILRLRNCAPRYPSSMLQLMLLPVDETNRDTEKASLQAMPQELLAAIGQTLTPNEKLHLVLATYRMRPEEIDLITHQNPSRPEDASSDETTASTKAE
ncbi:MAG: hypothetical protein Q9168_006087 [Polycauliona sp. 1 TL-2023]